MNSLTTPTRLSRKWKCEFDFWGVYVCLQVWVRDLTMEVVCLDEYFKLDYVELLSMKEDVWAGKGW